MAIRSATGPLVKSAGLVAFCIATPAQADDWRLNCSFVRDPLAVIVDYDAGGPDYALTVTQSGGTELGRGQRIVLRPIRTPDDIILIGTGLADMSVILRINSETQVARIEIGNGASWDYKTLQGRCSVLQQ